MDTNEDFDPVDAGTGSGARRSFLRKAAAGVLGGAVAAFGLTRPASAAPDSGQAGGTANARPGAGGGGVTPLWKAYCCDLLYGLCTSSQWSNCSNRWSWTCCAYVGSYLQRVSCGECYSAHCSRYAFGAAC